jgi:3-hydroxybutyryl-CoA dehydrogenase
MSGTATKQAIERVAVLGAGTMGHGIAQVAAAAGAAVRLTDVAPELVERAVDRIRANLDQGVARGKVSQEARAAILARVVPAESVAGAVADADLVIEAAPEVLAVKRQLFAQVVAAAPTSAILATNTSSLAISAIAEQLPEPGRLVGLHFFNPVHIMKLVEIVRQDANADATIETLQALVQAMGKTPIVVRDVPGFASSRLGLALGLEAMRMVEQGVASAADIDSAMKLGYGHPMGPLELTDLVGLDVRLHIADYLAERLGPAFRAPDILRAKVAAGKLGTKAGEGFYRWRDGKPIR